MLVFDGIKENFKFLVLEVKNQIYATFDFINEPTPKLYDKILAKDDYIDNLKNIIENKCFSRTLPGTVASKEEVNILRAMHIMAVNLERMADHCVNIVRQIQYFSDYKFIHNYNYEDMLTEIHSGTAEIETTLESLDLSKALDICRCENNLDAMYKYEFDRILKELKSGRDNTQDYITALFIFRYLERIGDALLNIGEALLFVIVGEKVKIHQFQALQETLHKSGFDGSVSDIDFQAIWGGRSGCRVGRVDRKPGDALNVQGSIFKEGVLAKIRQERDNLEKWNNIFPGLVPRVLSYYEDEDEQKDERKASMLVEFISGCTLDEVVLTSSTEILSNAYFLFEQTLSEIWEHTLEQTDFKTNYTRQALDRIESVRQVYPQFNRGDIVLNSSRIGSCKYLLEQCLEIESELSAPSTIFIHGDFNINNIVYNHTEQKISYIDVYRSKNFDYIQDISVFLVSNFRIPVFEQKQRKRLDWIIFRFYHFVSGFAGKHGDETFAIRLALGLARSFYTSTRFELNYMFAQNMYMRSIYLMERIVGHKGKSWETFKLPEQVMYY